MSPALDKCDYIKVDTIRKEDVRHTEVFIVTREKKKRVEKEQIIGSISVCESTLSAPDPHINA